MAKLKKQTVRVVLEYKVTGAPGDASRPTTAKAEREVARGFAEIINLQGYDMPVKLKSVEVIG